MTTVEASAPIATADGVAALCERVREAAANRTPLVIRGGNTKAWYGNRSEGESLDVRGHAGIVDYEPSELVLVARAGTPLADVEAHLAAHDQMLAFEPPHFSSLHTATTAMADQPETASAVARALAATARRTTLGGCVAAGLSGPRRATAGAVRDFVLGARVIDGRGRELSFGGRVMKNVAGYDVSRALAGSLGILGIVTEVSMKVLPRPQQSVTVLLDLEQTAALERLNQWAGLPNPIAGSLWESVAGRAKGRLYVRLEGSEAAVQSGIRRIGGLQMDAAEADERWVSIREHTDDFFTSRAADMPLWRLSLPSTAPALDAGRLGFERQLVEWGGALRWIATRTDGETVRRAAATLGGHATLWRGSDDLKAKHGAFAPLLPPVMAIHRRLKAEFDPQGIFNRGRLYADL